ncbi:MAG TPA: hypothetical protein PLQ78_01295 [Flavipsychrobacter sp.]|jgi:uncharacterized coiled-coil protein SlyX|nr:hypothetical protein [Flavipsychrobacter sp.]
MSDWKDIWKQGIGSLSEEQIQAYLNGTLNNDEVREIEQLLSDTAMESDAIEGLNTLNKVETDATVKKLNQTLQKLVQKRKKRNSFIATNKWTWLAVILVILLAVLAFWVIYFALP